MLIELLSYQNSLSEQKATSIWAAVNGIEGLSDLERLANFFVFVIAGPFSLFSLSYFGDAL